MWNSVTVCYNMYAKMGRDNFSQSQEYACFGSKLYCKPFQSQGHFEDQIQVSMEMAGYIIVSKMETNQLDSFYNY